MYKRQALTSETKINPLLPAKEIARLIMEDLKNAEELLAGYDLSLIHISNPKIDAMRLMRWRETWSVLMMIVGHLVIGRCYVLVSLRLLCS